MRALMLSSYGLSGKAVWRRAFLLLPSTTSKTTCEFGKGRFRCFEICRLVGPSERAEAAGDS